MISLRQAAEVRTKLATAPSQLECRKSLQRGADDELKEVFKARDTPSAAGAARGPPENRIRSGGLVQMTDLHRFKRLRRYDNGKLCHTDSRLQTDASSVASVATKAKPTSKFSLG
jgi:hypothetical protein